MALNILEMILLQISSLSDLCHSIFEVRKVLNAYKTQSTNVSMTTESVLRSRSPNYHIE